MSGGSSEYFVSSCGHYCSVFYCSVCGSVLRPVQYQGKEPLPVMDKPDFGGFLGCLRVDLHDKVVNGVNYRGKVFIKAVFK